MPLRAAPANPARCYYLDPLVHSQSYVPGKNSYRWRDFKKGDRRTVLERSGAGSVRHIWAAWSGRGNPRIFIYADDDETPAVEGVLSEVFESAARTGTRYIPQPSFNFEGSYNLYLPIYFSSGIRIEIESEQDLPEFAIQIDYHLCRQPESKSRLVAINDPSGLLMRYAGSGAPDFSKACGKMQAPSPDSKEFDVAPGGDAQFSLDGPATLRQLTLEARDLADVELTAHWDGNPQAAMQAPLRYLFGGFRSVAADSRPGSQTLYFPMPFWRTAFFRFHNPGAIPVHLIVRYSLDRKTSIPGDAHYFHASFREEKKTSAYTDVVTATAIGEGHLVGLNLFGASLAMAETIVVDADSNRPRILHGTGGEEFFGFTGHKAGRFQLFAGASALDRRFRHLADNPIPFQSSLRLYLAVPPQQVVKSVAFWYQRAGVSGPPAAIAPDISWKVLGPMKKTATPPELVDERFYGVEVLFDKLEKFRLKWDTAMMSGGFLDLTQQWRKWVPLAKGLPGESRLRLSTIVTSPAAQKVHVLLGHDDAVTVRLNGLPVAQLPERIGFGTSPVEMPLKAGPNKLTLLVDNGDNLNWRWNGITLSIDSPATLKFEEPLH